jgi:hypothetical protein
MLLLFLVKSLLFCPNILLRVSINLRDKSLITKFLIGATFNFWLIKTLIKGSDYISKVPLNSSIILFYLISSISYNLRFSSINLMF